MKRILLPALLALTALGASAAQAAATAAPQRMARVAGGAQVKLVSSAETPAQWTARRPGVRALRPKTRGTFD